MPCGCMLSIKPKPKPIKKKTRGTTKKKGSKKNKPVRK
jgi:hypothetical protein